MTIVIGYPELDGEHIYNSVMLVQPNGEAANYRKVQLFSRETVVHSRRYRTSGR